MAEYFNQFTVRTQEIATLQFNHFMGEDETDVIAYVVCNIELLPAMAKTLQDVYNGYKAKMAEDKAARETNKSLS